MRAAQTDSVMYSALDGVTVELSFKGQLQPTGGLSDKQEADM